MFDIDLWSIHMKTCEPPNTRKFLGYQPDLFLHLFICFSGLHICQCSSKLYEDPEEMCLFKESYPKLCTLSGTQSEHLLNK